MFISKFLIFGESVKCQLQVHIMITDICHCILDIFLILMKNSKNDNQKLSAKILTLMHDISLMQTSIWMIIIYTWPWHHTDSPNISDFEINKFSCTYMQIFKKFRCIHKWLIAYTNFWKYYTTTRKKMFSKQFQIWYQNSAYFVGSVFAFSAF